jgi:hypothetical protein
VVHVSVASVKAIPEFSAQRNPRGARWQAASAARELPNRVGDGTRTLTPEGEARAHRVVSVLDRLGTASGWRNRDAAVNAPRSIWSRAGVTRED